MRHLLLRLLLLPKRNRCFGRMNANDSKRPLPPLLLRLRLRLLGVQACLTLRRLRLIMAKEAADRKEVEAAGGPVVLFYLPETALASTTEARARTATTRGTEGGEAGVCHPATLSTDRMKLPPHLQVLIEKSRNWACRRRLLLLRLLGFHW